MMEQPIIAHNLESSQNPMGLSDGKIIPENNFSGNIMYLFGN